jgi:hypothetical protein
LPFVVVAYRKISRKKRPLREMLCAAVAQVLCAALGKLQRKPNEKTRTA